MNENDKKQVEGNEWLTDKHINAVNNLLSHWFPSQNGLMCPLILDENKKYESSSDNFVQIINNTQALGVCVQYF